MSVTRPVLRYHGGKFLLAPWIISHFPLHRTYVEPYGGAASVLLRKPRAKVGEVYNDLSGDIVNIFRVLRDPDMAEELRRLVRLTPYARTEFDLSYAAQEGLDSVAQAHRMIVRSWMGFSPSCVIGTHRTGFRNDATRRNTPPAADWADWPHSIAEFTERLRGVVIECRDALEVMTQHDDPNTLHYVDPPYVHATRTALANRDSIYEHEMTDDDHVRLATTLKQLGGMVVLSGYDNGVYRDCLHDWQKRERTTFADGAKSRIEVLWLNPACAERQVQRSLFAW